MKKVKTAQKKTLSSGAVGQHLLVIRLSAMGDVAMMVPVLSALVHQYPDLKITVLTRAFFNPLFFELPNVQVYEADVKGKHSGVFGLWKLYKELKALQIDAVADLHNVLRSKILKQYYQLGEIPFFQIDKGRADKKALTAKQNKVFKPLKTTCQRYAYVFAQLGFSLDMSKAPLLPQQQLTAKVLKLVGSNTKKWIGIAPFAAFKGKMYPLHLMEEVIEQLNNTGKYKILLLGGGKEEVRQLEAWQAKYPSCTNTAGKFDFSDELKLISNLDVMLAMDSGNAHLSSIYGIKTITLWGVTHPYAGFYPFGQDADNALLADREKFPLIPTSIYGNKMPEGYEKAIETIHPNTISRKIETLLG
ncbi:ADP-heptose:LPS heptosyltransferase [hydrothermal vent metagenome]|uniref:ADP-heptose:LPS heptosyltransferase n=1 Tax=hydrothermal vent metagenome TaxID=652676 RepID=A0A3B0TEY4_9ZZZZ